MRLQVFPAASVHYCLNKVRTCRWTLVVEIIEICRRIECLDSITGTGYRPEITILNPGP